MYLGPIQFSVHSPMKSLLKKYIPGLWLDYYAKFKYNKKKSRFLNMEANEVFERIYRENLWSNPESRSGPGSTRVQALAIAPDFRKILDQLEIRTILDAPCGDFNWMSAMDIAGIGYTGIDIVSPLILENERRYSKPGINFLRKDLTRDTLPCADLILSRDCLVHFSYRDIGRALKNMISSQSRYIMTTSFPAQGVNYDITTGDWRALNLEIHPFYFPKPVAFVPESVDKKFEKCNKGKLLGVWDLKILEQHLSKNDYQFQ